ncbi:metallophosphoesterase family protein [Massilia sp. GER05]|uniref:metallophosphoesterase family protein n=1 Tax=Massilia sp. GER05 TaxID=3394605 RepID=UPI003F85A435
MRLALLTDLHANREAVEACLAHAERQHVDQYAFTGDFVGYGADPAWVVRTVMEYVARGAVAVQGNHDVAVTRPLNPRMHAEAREVIAWTGGQLEAGQLAFLAALPLVQRHGNACFVHASAHAPERWEYVTGTEEAERSIRASGSRIVFSGHVHAPALYRRADDGRMGRHVPQAGEVIPLQPQHQYLVLPGAVGQPRDQNNAACYAVFDDAAREIQYFRVPYDHGAAARKVIAAGLPIVFAMRLVEGI